MKHLIHAALWLLLLIGFFPTNCSAQFIESLSENGGGPYVYLGEELANRDLADVLREDDVAFRKFRGARSLSWAGAFVGSIGSILLTDELTSGNLFSNNPETNLRVLGYSALFIGVGAFMTIKAEGKVRRAVSLYNEWAPEPATSSRATVLKIGWLASGPGLSLRF